MGLPNSGTISLNDIHVQAGGGDSTSCSINDTDIRGLIGKGSGTSMSFSEWYGAGVFTFNVSTSQNFEQGPYSGVQLKDRYRRGTPETILVIRENGNIQKATRSIGFQNSYNYTNIGTWSTSNRQNAYMKYSNIQTRGTQINSPDFSTGFQRVYGWDNDNVSKGARYTGTGNGRAYVTFDWTIRDGNAGASTTQRVQCYTERDD